MLIMSGRSDSGGRLISNALFGACVELLCSECWAHYVAERWILGTGRRLCAVRVALHRPSVVVVAAGFWPAVQRRVLDGEVALRCQP